MEKAMEEEAQGSQIIEEYNNDQTQGVEASIHAPQPSSSAGDDLEYFSQ